MAIVAWPPPVPPNDRINSTPIADAHPLDHNKIADALDTLLAKVPLGRQGSATSASTATITTTFTELVNVAFTALAARRYRASGVIVGTTGTGPQVVWVEITDAANTRLQLASFHAATTGLLFSLPIWVEIPPGAAGARTYRLRIATNVATATLSGSATTPHALLVEDIGT